MKKIPNIVIVNADDWEGLYIDGDLKTEGHSLSLQNVLDILKIHTTFRYDVDYEWLEEIGRLPKSLSDVKFTKG